MNFPLKIQKHIQKMASFTFQMSDTILQCPAVQVSTRNRGDSGFQSTKKIRQNIQRLLDSQQFEKSKQFCRILINLSWKIRRNLLQNNSDNLYVLAKAFLKLKKTVKYLLELEDPENVSFANDVEILYNTKTYRRQLGHILRLSKQYHSQKISILQ